MSSIDREHKPSGFAAFEKRISELIRLSGSIPPDEVMQLLMQADADPTCDISKAFRNLLKKHRTSQKNPPVS